jgi:hypothetical protein
MRTDRGFSDKLLTQALDRGASLAEVGRRASQTLSVDVKHGEVEAVGNEPRFYGGMGSPSILMGLTEISA